jgi:hypothetical protein
MLHDQMLRDPQSHDRRRWFAVLLAALRPRFDSGR